MTGLGTDTTALSESRFLPLARREVSRFFLLNTESVVFLLSASILLAGARPAHPYHPVTYNDRTGIS